MTEQEMKDRTMQFGLRIIRPVDALPERRARRTTSRPQIKNQNSKIENP
jgi:hypothetical protein